MLGLKDVEHGASPERALAFFDRLPPVGIEQLSGVWSGTVVATGHPLDGLLARLGWYGKRFDGPEGVHPLVMGKQGALYSITPSVVPLAWMRRNARLLGTAPVATAARVLLRLLRTESPKARLRMTEFRGAVSATMIYDTLPIQDVFRHVNESTVLGVMDARGDVSPNFLYFLLRRAR